MASRLFWAASLGTCVGLIPLGRTQEIQFNDGTALPQARRQHVELQTAVLQVKAGQPDWAELRFQVAPGMHINSHTPKDELLVPTMLVLQPEPVKVLEQEYPAGVPLHLDTGGGETLSTYQGEFRVRVRLSAPKGDAQLQGELRYQACDAHSCFPPKRLLVQVAVSAR